MRSWGLFVWEIKRKSHCECWRHVPDGHLVTCRKYNRRNVVTDRRVDNLSERVTALEAEYETFRRALRKQPWDSYGNEAADNYRLSQAKI